MQIINKNIADIIGSRTLLSIGIVFSHATPNISVCYHTSELSDYIEIETKRWYKDSKTLNYSEIPALYDNSTTGTAQHSYEKELVYLCSIGLGWMSDQV